MRHFIEPGSFSLAEQLALLDLADRMEADPAPYAHLCDGRILATLFYEPSTRTRLSFESAMLRLGGKTLGFAGAQLSSASKGETVADTARVVSNYADVIAMRHPKEGAPLRASLYARVPVINAGDGAHAHTTQALLELFTLKEAGKNIKGMKYVIIGDILHSRVARSDIYGFTKLGAEVHLVGPRTLVPKELESMGVIVDDNLEDALRDADAINILRIQLERAAGGFIPTTREYARLFGINKKRLELCKKDAAIIHPGPMNRGIEIGYDVAYDE